MGGGFGNGTPERRFMAQFSADILRAEVPYSVAERTLTAIPDAEIVRMITPEMVPFLELSDIAWVSEEPEHETLAPVLRAQLMEDLQTMYRGHSDIHCERHLAATVDNESGQAVLIVLFNNYPDDDEDDGYDFANPVNRLRRVAVCTQAAATTYNTTTRPLGSTPTPGFRGNSSLAQRAYNDNQAAIRHRLVESRVNIAPPSMIIDTAPTYRAATAIWDTHWNTTTASTTRHPISQTPGADFLDGLRGNLDIIADNIIADNALRADTMGDMLDDDEPDPGSPDPDDSEF